MSKKPFLYKVIGVALVLVLALSAGSMVAAQSDQVPFLGIGPAPDTDGVRVVDVVPDSPAAQAGIKAGDVITLFDGKPASIETLAAAVQSHKVGDTVSVTLLRDGKTSDVSVVLAERPKALDTPPALTQRPFLGLALANSDKGVVINQVVPQSPAAEAGLVEGDLITAINGTQVTEARAAVKFVAALKPGDKVKLDILHDGDAKSVEVTLGSAFGRPQGSPFGPRGGKSLGLSFDGKQWTITDLSEDSALYKAGLRSGDVLTAINGETFEPAALMKLLMTSGRDATIKVTVERDGKSQDVAVPVQALRMVMMGAFMERRPGLPFMPGKGGRLGVAYLPLDEQVAKDHNVEIKDGALITEVVPDSPAATAGLKPNDIVTAVNGEAVDVEHVLTDRIRAYEPGDKITLEVVRGSEKLQIEVTLGQGQFMPHGRRGFPFKVPRRPGTPPIPPTKPQT